MTRYRTDGTCAVTPRPFKVGDQAKLDTDPEWWTVQAVTENFTALTRPFAEADAQHYQRMIDEGLYEDGPDGDTLYTVIDWRNGVRGPCDLSGQAWGDGTYSPEECAEMLAQFEDGTLHVSQRNWLRIRFTTVAPAAVVS